MNILLYSSSFGHPYASPDFRELCIEEAEVLCYSQNRIPDLERENLDPEWEDIQE